jgi:hypothetical protein
MVDQLSYYHGLLIVSLLRIHSSNTVIYTVKREGDDHDSGGSNDGRSSNALCITIIRFQPSAGNSSMVSGYNGHRELSTVVIVAFVHFSCVAKEFHKIWNK